MRFREGDKVEFIWSGKLKQGVVTEIEETKNAISYQIKYSGDMGMTWLDERDLVAPAPVLKVPQFADDWIKHCKQSEYDLACLLDYEDSDMSAEMYEWLISSADNQELLARAWLDGYEVEEEPLYYVRLPFASRSTDFEKETTYTYIIVNITTDEMQPSTSNRNYGSWKAALTESEIKAMPEGDIYWQFAVLVDEADGEDNE
ncbi:TPA: DUF1642 domain-containing protein [Listeria monocytogenes]|uniref:DUF1642 domain-containing protein n=1 Tax=Listeria monocytogenes TaxID=1639 RepID=UPI000E7214E3|nr:DUF1642 domain-containing protein [Listeria monocytogenes]EAC2339477.1 DUF1642 domain-containing protein [Listeria monocytogenes]EAC2677483.1 DUF1642 domain-containing protein [Listeria monocytogenes]EAC4066624.1 DUF1642 domain-containing protein [Listeria monocytogenes]EAC8671204.1 DUF1642 domain-containing protein [Listeria monocytogenes]EAC8918107.1 DUF1642 domain-containing protein [Listeria monocytogenes]